VTSLRIGSIPIIVCSGGERTDAEVKLAERGKTLVFVDACHCELASAESGVVVFSSSTSTQLSIEDDTLKHGDFTAALLEAFDTRRATHEPPFFYVTDFDAYLRGRVKELTHGAQTPTVTIPLERYNNPRVFRTVEAP